MKLVTVICVYAPTARVADVRYWCLGQLQDTFNDVIHDDTLVLLGDQVYETIGRHGIGELLRNSFSFVNPVNILDIVTPIS